VVTVAEPLTPAYEAAIREHVDGMINYSLGNLFARDLLAEVDRLRARVAELERPSIEARRNEIRSSYTELISQAEQDRDAEGAATLTLQLREFEAKWTAEDPQTGGA
jgi:uncharacterized protein YgbK (DUF1537 family)